MSPGHGNMDSGYHTGHKLPPVIVVDKLVKDFRTHERAPGLANSFRNLFWRSYRTIRAVDGISFDVRSGERIGFLGPNGAGKTTTLKILSGVLHPSSGAVRVDDYVPYERRYPFLRNITLVMGQKDQLLWDLPPGDTFELNRSIFNVDDHEYRQTLDELVALFEIGDVMRKPTRELSLGERMKCELVAALIHRPKILFLDEPTIGLDVSMQITIRNFIRRYNEKWGATVILTSHYMDDVLALCPRVIVINKGVISFDGALDELVRHVRPEKRLTLILKTPVARRDLEGLGKIIEHDDGRCVVQVDQDAVRQVIQRAMASLPVSDLTLENAPLEEVMSEFFSRTASKDDDAA